MEHTSLILDTQWVSCQTCYICIRGRRTGVLRCYSIIAGNHSG